MKKALAVAALIGVAAAIVLVAITAFNSPAKKAPPKPYTIGQASGKLVAYYSAKLTAQGAAISGTRCLRLTKNAQGAPVRDTTGTSSEFACILNVVTVSTGASAACVGVSFSLPAGASAPKVDGTQPLDAATYCTGP